MKDKKRAKRKDKKRSMAKSADKYDLYQRSVQDPEGDVQLIRRIFKKRYGRDAHRLREDFCGTAALACEWVKEDPENLAWGLDLDPEPLAWGKEHNLSLLPPDASTRIQLVEGDVRDVVTELVDVTCAFNFSYLLFKARKELLAYLRHARSTLLDEGLLVLDLYGGADANRTMTETREDDGFDYVWDQDLFDPIRHDATNYIHFEFPDGSRIQKAFKYEWRLWTIPELRDVLEEAGFSEVEVYWEGTDRKTNEGNGIYRKAERAPDDPAWITYLVAVP